MRVLGYLDETRVLHGRRLRSFTVLGGLSLVPKLVEEEGLTGIVVAIHRPRQGLLDQLQVLAEQHGLKIYRWNVLLDESDWSAEAAPEVTKEVVAAPVHAPVKVAAAELSGVA